MNTTNVLIGFVVFIFLVIAYNLYQNNQEPPYKITVEDGKLKQGVSKKAIQEKQVLPQAYPIEAIKKAQERLDETGVDQSLDQNAIKLVSKAIEQNKLGVTAKDLVTKKNPKGEGTFVYVSQKRFFGV